MSKRKVALILSFICCGLGQLYKGEILKGISFIMVYALLIASILLSPSPLLTPPGFPILLLVWSMGMLDSFVDDETLIGKKRWLTWRKLLALLPVAVISLAIITITILWLQILSLTDERLASDADSQILPETLGVENIQSEDQFLDSEFFSVQVGAFRHSEQAKSLHDELLRKGYPVRIEQSKEWHRVLVGKFRSEQEAISFAGKLSEQEGLSYMIVCFPSNRTREEP